MGSLAEARLFGEDREKYLCVFVLNWGCLSVKH